MLYWNRRQLRIVLFGLTSAASLAVSPVMAGSQSSNSSSNCSNGRCSRVDTLVIEDRRGRIHGWAAFRGLGRTTRPPAPATTAEARPRRLK
jgi:hypothetical protein